MTELENIIETIWSFDCDSTPCECGLRCPYYAFNNETGEYCDDGDCTGGLIKLIKEAVKREAE